MNNHPQRSPFDTDSHIGFSKRVRKRGEKTKIKINEDTLYAIDKVVRRRIKKQDFILDYTEDNIEMTPPHLSTEGEDSKNKDSSLHLSHLHMTRSESCNSRA